MFAAGADPGFVGPEAYTIIGALFKTKYNIRYESEYLFVASRRALEGPPCKRGALKLELF